MQNPEQQLIASVGSGLGVVVAGHESFPDPKNTSVTLQPGQPWPAGAVTAWRSSDPRNVLAAYDAYLGAAEKGGSWNQLKLCLGCLWLLGTPTEKAAATAASIELMKAERDTYGWMGAEPMSRVDYGIWHLDHALLSVRFGSPALQALAWQWLDLYAFVLRQTWDPKLERCLWYGERSAEAGHDGPATYDWLAAYLVGSGSWKPDNTLDELVIAKLKPEIDQWKARPLANPAWRTEQPITIYQGSDGSRAILLGREMNHNTPACCAASTAGGVLKFAPPTPWPPRIRERNTGGACVEQNGQLVYTSADVKDFPATKLEVPPNPSKFRLGNGTAQAVGLPVPTPTPGVTATAPGSVVQDQSKGVQTPAPGLLARFVAWLRGLL
jgi:hypothetical protein